MENLENDLQYGRRIKKRRRYNKIPFIFIIVIFLIFFVFISIYFLKYIGIGNDDRISVVVRDRIVDDKLSIYKIDDEKYFSIDFIKEYIDNTVFLEDNKDTITITNTNNVIRLNTDDLTYYVNSQPLSLELPIISQNDVMLMPTSLAQSLYDLNISYVNNEKKAIIDFNGEQKETATVKKLSKIYESPDKKSKKVASLKKDSNITVFENENGYYKVRGEYGDVGYIQQKNVSEIYTESAYSNDNRNIKSFEPINGKITMVWDQVFNASQNKNNNKYTPIEGLDVISPTWFAISDSSGTVSNIADKTYVDWAHSMGYEVWALFSNSFDSNITHNTLSNPNTREKIIKQILAYSQLYDIDGINIDFESIKKADGKYFVQFVREITPYLKAQGLTVSVDLSRPEGWNSYYGMEEIASVVDYVILMAYDEHWATSPESGSVASMDWTEKSITSSLDMVPNEKLILGIPFYTRIWEEKIVDGKSSVSSSSLGIEATFNYISKNNMEIVYDEKSGQNYSSIEKDGATYKIWIEDDLSIRKRMEFVNKYDVAGIAGWKRHLEGKNTWNIINEYTKN